LILLSSFWSDTLDSVSSEERFSSIEVLFSWK
jgi:hypothetical protein